MSNDVCKKALHEQAGDILGRFLPEYRTRAVTMAQEELTEAEQAEVVAAGEDRHTARARIKDVLTRAYDRRRVAAAEAMPEQLAEDRAHAERLKAEEAAKREAPPADSPQEETPKEAASEPAAAKPAESKAEAPKAEAKPEAKPAEKNRLRRRSRPRSSVSPETTGGISHG